MKKNKKRSTFKVILTFLFIMLFVELFTIGMIGIVIEDQSDKSFWGDLFAGNEAVIGRSLSTVSGLILIYIFTKPSMILED